MSVIEATSVQVKTMADDTLRLTVDIDPRHAQEAFKLFGVRGAPMVLARLTQQAAQEHAREETEESQKGGPLAKLAGQWCKMPEFWKWIDARCPGMAPVRSEHEAAAWLRGACNVESRSEIDHDEGAAKVFHFCIREPFSKVLRDAT